MTALYLVLAIVCAGCGTALIWLSGRLLSRRVTVRERPVVEAGAEPLRLSMLASEKERLVRALRESGDKLQKTRADTERLQRELRMLKERTPALKTAHVVDIGAARAAELAEKAADEVVDALCAQLDLERAAHSRTRRRLHELCALIEDAPTKPAGPPQGEGDDSEEFSTRRLTAAVFDTPAAPGLRVPRPSSPPPAEVPIADLLGIDFPSSRVAFVAVDAAGAVRLMSPRAASMTGFGEEEALGRPFEEVFVTAREWRVHGVDVPVAASEILDDGEEETYLVHRGGQRIPIDVCAIPLRDGEGRYWGRAVLALDRSEQRLQALQLARTVAHDPLTGLLNRHAFLEHVDRVIASERSPERPGVLCLFDLDHFRLANDTCGHEAGDALLQWVSAILRESTAEEDVIGRLGGDEFGVVFVGRTAEEVGHLTRLVQRRLSAFKFTWNETLLAVSASVGVVPLTARFRAVEDALCAADMSCHRAKLRGRGHAHEFREGDRDLERDAAEMRCAAGMAHDLRAGRFSLFGQRIRPFGARDGADGELLHFEVLLRALDDERGLVSPAEVIRAAEQHGGMGALDRWVVRNSLKLLRAKGPALLDRLGTCSINLSSASFRSDGLLEYIHEQVAASGVPPAALCFEIPEAVAADDLKRAQWLGGGLRAIGCRFALDDFGAGPTSAGNLRELPVDAIKIDSALMCDLGERSAHRVVVDSANRIGHFLGARTIAEGVGSRAALEEVVRLGVDFGQGFAIEEPRPLEELLADFLEGGDAPAAGGARAAWSSPAECGTNSKFLTKGRPT
jgi:diguanylate cyclase (GGDEF)-like protein/PAS domain S-box-containing protein